MIELRTEGRVAEIRIQHPNGLNPISMGMTRDLRRVFEEVQADDGIDGVWIWGGEGRSFSVGGDFRELQDLVDYDETYAYLGDIVECYAAALAVDKPFVAAMDQHAIGLGLQVGLMTDWRVATERCVLSMPELAGGVPCPLGSVILERLLGRAAMLELVMGCGKLSAAAAREFRLVQEVTGNDELEVRGRSALERLVSYPALAYRLTKRIQNGRMLEALAGVKHGASDAHGKCFAAKSGALRFAEVLGDGGA